MSQEAEVYRIVTKEMPALVRPQNLIPRKPSSLQLTIRALNVGECLEYRGKAKRGNVQNHCHRAAKATGSKYAMRPVEPQGFDVFRTK